MKRRSLPAWYNGTLYRSHLEARWAIFFDRLDIKARYEPQGFDLGDGVLYLPDFVIFAACGTLWAEVKPEWDADTDGVERWRRFAAMRPSPSQSRAALLVGPPSFEIATCTVIGGDDAQDDPLQGPWEDSEYAWRPCSAGYHFDLYHHKFKYAVAPDSCPMLGGADGWERIEVAVSASLSHRFGKFGPGKAA